jgi:hypothetical protein
MSRVLSVKSIIMYKVKQLRQIGLLLFVAFLVNVTLPYFVGYIAPQATSEQSADQELASLLGDKILICTSEGFKWVSWEDVQSGKEQPKPHTQFQCALCYMAAYGAGSFLVSQSFDFVLNSSVGSFDYPITGADLVEQFAYSNFRTRAPPYSA